MPTFARSAAAGALAGAAGTSALNAVTYLDMAIRGREASSTPEDSIERLARMVGLGIPGSRRERRNRLAGLGPLAGLLVGSGMGVAAAVVVARLRSVRTLPLPARAAAVALAAMATTDSPMAVLGITDPRTWALGDWLADVVPHAAYGAVTALVLEFLTTEESL